ncbi:MAG: hypothetical protein EBT18_11080 [Gammaproteobacteria bacterium]|nr:hypothetical protein [Gammaproteobacteria bacterium]
MHSLYFEVSGRFLEIAQLTAIVFGRIRSVGRQNDRHSKKTLRYPPWSGGNRRESIRSIRNFVGFETGVNHWK